MVADAEVRVGLHVVAGELPETRPGIEEARPAGAHVGNRVAPAFDRPGQRGAQRVERVFGLGFEHRFGNATWREANVSHEAVMLMATPNESLEISESRGRRCRASVTRA